MIGLEDQEKMDACQSKLLAYVGSLEKDFDIRTIVLCLVKISAYNTKLFIDAEHPLGSFLAMAWEKEVGNIEEVIPELEGEEKEKAEIMKEYFPNKEED